MKKLKLLVILTICVLLTGAIFPGNLFAEIVTEEWVARYNGPANSYDGASTMAVDDAGNVYVTGQSYGSGTGSDYATVKYDANGTQLWAATYNGPGNSFDIAEAIAVDTSGNVYVTGQSYGSGTGYDYATVKYDAATGNQLWAARYNGTANGWDYATAIAIDSSDNVYVTGYSAGSGTGNDYATVKYDGTTGNQLWVATYNGPGNSTDIAKAIAVDSSGNVYVTGQSYGSGTYDDYATVKYDDTTGNQLWVARYNGPANSYDFVYAIALDSSGNVYVTGSSYDSDTGPDYATVKYDTTGTQLWATRYNGPGNSTDYAEAIAVDSSGNVYVTGHSYGIGTGPDYATVKYDTATGNEEWVARYNGPASFSDVARAIAVDTSGNVYVTGREKISDSATGYDYATVKYAPNGTELWVASYNGPGNSYDFATAIAVDSSGNVYVTGRSYGSGTHYDCATVKYSQPPAAPVIGVVDYDEAAGNTTVAGTAEPGAIIKIYDENGNLIYETTADENGDWECFVPGNYEGSSITVTASDEDGNTSPPSQPPVPTWPDVSTLTASGVGLTDLTLTWTPAAHDVGIAGYLLYQDEVFIGNVTAEQLSYTVIGLEYFTEYAFKVEACDGQSYCSDDGPSLTVRTLTPVETIEQLVNQVLALNLPKGFVGKLNDAIKVLIDANPNNDSAAGNKLNDFIKQVNNNIDKIIGAGGNPYALIDAAEAIIAVIEAG